MMVHLTIDGQPVEVEEGTTILQAAKKACIHIPTLCYHEDLSIKAVCRICVVEVEGQRLLPTACSTPVSEGMVVQTASPKVLKARRNILELIFARHPQECLVCPKDGKCDLQKVAQDVGMHLDIRYDKQLRHQKEDWSSPAIMRNPQKCILCGRCMEVCNEIQGINVLSKENRGFHTLIAPAYGEKLADTNCINCGQCVQVCPTGALTVHYHTYGLYRQKELGKKLIIQVAPSVRITLAEALGEQPGVVSTGRLVSALKRLGFYKVFDSAVGKAPVSDRNTISACVYGAQSVTDGQAVKLRLLDPMAVAERIIPRNAVVVGTAKIQGERLDIGITSLEYQGTIIPVELTVYDTDGQEGIFIPNSMEMNAVREVAANMGGSLGSSINISTDAGAQLASDLGKGLIQGTSQYIAKKMRTVKVHLKAGYRVMLYQDRE